MRHAVLVTPDTPHDTMARALWSAAGSPPGWAVTYASTTSHPDIATCDLLALPNAATWAQGFRVPGRLVVAGHGANAPGRLVAPWASGLVVVGARASVAGTEAVSSYGPGLWLNIDPAPVGASHVQSWAVYAAALTLARAWTEYGTAEAAQASLVASARAASSQESWVEETGYGVLPAYVLPPPGALVDTDTLSWQLFGAPASGTITSVVVDGRAGVRIVAGVGSSRLRARAVDAAPYADGQLYRRPVYARNLSSTTEAWLVSRATERAFRLAPGAVLDTAVWEMKGPPAYTGFDPQWQLRSGYLNDVPGAVLDVFVDVAPVEAYDGGPLTLPALAAPEPVAPFAVTATPGADGATTIAWATVPDPAAPCVVSVGGVDVAAGASPQVVALSVGPQTVRVRLGTGETEDHSTVDVTVPEPPAPLAVTVTDAKGHHAAPGQRRGRRIEVTWAAPPGVSRYRVEVGSGAGTPTVIETTTPQVTMPHDGRALRVRVWTLRQAVDGTWVPSATPAVAYLASGRIPATVPGA